jgi:hypothetical protein
MHLADFAEAFLLMLHPRLGAFEIECKWEIIFTKQAALNQIIS